MTSKGQKDWLTFIWSLLSRLETRSCSKTLARPKTVRLVLVRWLPVGGTIRGDLAEHIHTRADLDIEIRPCLRHNTLKAACLSSHLYMLTYQIQYLNPSLLQYSSPVQKWQFYSFRIRFRMVVFVCEGINQKAIFGFTKILPEIDEIMYTNYVDESERSKDFWLCL